MKYWNGVDAPHSSPWKSIGTNGERQHQRRADLHALGARRARRALAGGAVADLVVVLEVAEEPVCGDAVERPAVPPAAELRSSAPA